MNTTRYSRVFFFVSDIITGFHNGKYGLEKNGKKHIIEKKEQRCIMVVLDIKNKENCRYDMLALGEVMLRLDPGDGRVRNTRSFRVWEGGGEYNVARGLRRCFGLRTAVVTAFADNDVG